MANSSVLVTVKYSSPGAQPPVYVAGTFCNWEPQEMDYTTDANNEHEFSKEFNVEEGKDYQYKFRLGPGDWWVLNENAPTSTDDFGNRNNLLTTPKQPIKAEEASAPSIERSEAVTTNSERMEGSEPSEPNGVNEPEPDITNHTASKSEPASSDMSDVAAEVADSAAIVDKEQPEPIISDTEAGRLGLRRLSNTPIPEVAKTAAEVADAAAIIDKNTGFDLPPTLSETELLNNPTDSGTVTPLEDRAPLFAYECMGSDAERYPQVQNTAAPLNPVTSNDEAAADEEIDYNDPTLEQFPHDRTSILERVRTVESRLGEDETHFDGTPISPVVTPYSPMNGSSRLPEHAEIPSISPALVATEQHPSPLGSIAEDSEELHEQDEELTRLPGAADSSENTEEPEPMRLNHNEETRKEGSEPSVNIQEISDSPSHPAEPIPDSNSPPEQTSNGVHKEPEPVQPSATQKDSPEGKDYSQEVGTSNEGPSTMVHPATPSSSEIAVDKTIGKGKSTAIETDSGRADSHLVSRKQQPPPIDRSATPNSLTSEHAAKSKNFLKAFWRVVFVEWIGGFITKLCGGGRRPSLLAISALLILGVAPALYFRAWPQQLPLTRFTT